MAMKPEVKKLWVDALRSGAYDQATGELRTKEGFCCLGVLCDISGQAQWTGRMYAGGAQYLPLEVQEWAGLQESDPFVNIVDDDNEPTSTLLSELNDNLGWDFNRIANVIEEQL